MCKLIFPRWTSHFVFIWYKWVNKNEVFRRFGSVCYLISSIYPIQLHHTSFLPFSSMLLLSTILWKETIAMRISVHNHKLCKEQMELCNILPFKPNMNKVHIACLVDTYMGPEWTNSHQCTSWSFCPLDGLHFFIRRRMGFISIHFFLLLTTVLLFFGSWPFFPGPDLTHKLPCSLFYPHRYCNNLGTLFIIPYWHSYPNN
jgi:hypothetical protein